MGQIVERCDFDVGDIIGARYRVQKILGEGSFGKVYLVNNGYEQLYALKLLRLWDVPSDIRKPLTDRFEMEYKTGQINCEYLVKSVDYGYVGGNPYIVMEYCPGGDITSLIGTHYSDVPRVCQQILSGLHALHTMGKVHRDLKPENVLLKGNGNAALTDFGIAGDRNHRMTEKNIFGKPTQVFGTYAYMPPEQVNRSRGMATVLPTTDIFSFGVLTYQLLTNHLPFGELTDISELPDYQRRGKKGEWDAFRLKHLPDAEQWINVIGGCLKPKIAERYQTAMDVLRDIPISRHIEAPVFQKPMLTNHGVILRILHGDDYGRIISLTDLYNKGKRLVRVGRGDNNDVIITERDVYRLSRYHCTIENGGSQDVWFIRDGQWDSMQRKWKVSTNGTYRNSQKITPDGVRLAPDDIITIGDVRIRIEFYINS